MIRKVNSSKTSKIITLPKSWVEQIERKYGVVLEEVELEVGDAIIITPVIPRKRVQEALTNGR